MKRHLALWIATALIIAVQISCTYWYANRPPRTVDRLERLRLDVGQGLIYANLGVHGSDDYVVIGMTPHAAIQMQFELTKFIGQINSAGRPQIQ